MTTSKARGSELAYHRAGPMNTRDSIQSFRPSAAAAVVGTTLEEHIMAGMRGTPGASGDFTSLMNAISLAVRIIHTRVRSAGLAGMLGYTGDTNVQGEEVQKLDVFANEVLFTVLERSGRVAVMASEEDEEVRVASESGKYIVCVDPLDGSSNIDVNISIGTIFSILRTPKGADAKSAPLQSGTEIVAAGYAVYGSSTILVLSTGHGVHCFTLDPGVGEFFLSHPNIRCPDKGSLYSINEGNASRWTDGVKKWAALMKSDDKARGLPYSARYVGSLVADAHRTLLKGGVFAYPADAKSPEGKLRLLYEANPMAFVFEQAGGAATNGADRILAIAPASLHQRTPLVLGSKDDVATYREVTR
jgi:fructose-1,6-bisphosphatase I